MRNHDEKRRDMCRSILPSTARKAARENKALLKRAHRSHIRQELRAWARHEDLYEYEGFVHEDNNRPITRGIAWYSTMGEVVWERRAHDKVGPLINWVEAIKDDLPGGTDEERFEALRQMLPDNLIGRHALTHVDHLFDLPSRYNYYRRWSQEEWAAGEQRRQEEFLAFVAGVRGQIIVNHRYINEVFRGFDTCAGLHDVDRFATKVARSGRGRTAMEKIFSGVRVKEGTFVGYDPKDDRRR